MLGYEAKRVGLVDCVCPLSPMTVKSESLIFSPCPKRQIHQKDKTAGSSCADICEDYAV